MKKNIYSRSLLLLSFFIFNGCLLLGQKVSDKQEDSVTPYPLGTTWYYHSSEKTGMDSPMHYGYIRHRVEKDVQIGEYKAQEVQTIHVDRLGVETALEPYYLYRKGGKAYVVEADTLRLLYDLTAEVGDIIPFPAHPDINYPNFSHIVVKVIEKGTINIDGRDLIRQIYLLSNYFEEGPWPDFGKQIEVIEDLGVLELDALYQVPGPYGIIIDHINPRPVLRCFLSDDFEYKAQFWTGRPCDAFQTITDLATVTDNATHFSLYSGFIRFHQAHAGLTYQILNVNGLQILKGTLKGGDDRINISALQQGLYILQWQESQTGLRHSAIFYNQL